MAKRCSKLPWTSSHWKISREKAPGLSCYLRFLEGRYAKEFSWLVVVPFPALEVLQIQFLQKCVIFFCLTLHYFWVLIQKVWFGRSGAKSHPATYWVWDPRQIIWLCGVYFLIWKTNHELLNVKHQDSSLCIDSPPVIVPFLNMR